MKTERFPDNYCVIISRDSRRSQGFQRAADSQPAALDDVGINHRGPNIFVAQQFLNSANVIARFKQMGGKTMSKGMTTDRFGKFSRPDRLFDGFLQAAFIHMVPAGLTGAGIAGELMSGKDVLSGPFASRIGIFSMQGVG